MSNVWVVGILTYGHVLAAIGWLGAVLTINIALAPLMGRFAPSTRIDLLQHFLPRFARMTMIFSGLTVVFGAALYSQVYQDASHTWDLVIGIGILLAILAFVDGAAVATPTANRLAAMARQVVAQPGTPPPAELPKQLARLQHAAMASLFLLIATLAFMVAAGQI